MFVAVCTRWRARAGPPEASDICIDKLVTQQEKLIIESNELCKN